MAAELEPVLDPDLPIFDAHHHLWDRPGSRYLADDLIDDIAASGHRVVKTAFVESGLFTVTPGGDERARAEAAMAVVQGERATARTGGAVAVCGIIVGHVDLCGSSVGLAIEQLRHVAGGRLRAIRHCGSWDADDMVRGGQPIAPPGLYGDPRFQDGLNVLHDYGLAFDAWAYQTQHGELLGLVRAFPDLPIVYNHVGGVLGVGPYAGKRDALYATWRSGLAALADCPRLHLKLGGLGMERSGFAFFRRHERPTGSELAQAWRPWLETAIELFGPARCMFESNFPVDRASCSYRALWNAFKLVAGGCGPADRTALFHDTADTFYGEARAP